LKILNKRFRKKSLYIIYLKSFLLFSAVVFVILLFLYELISYKNEQMWNPTLTNLLEYSTELSRDEFSNIPIHKFQSGSFMVLNENYNVLYRNNRLIEESITEEELNCIAEYDSNNYFTVSRFSNTTEERYLVAEKSYSEDSMEIIKRFCILDKDYHILSGSLFQNQKSLTEKEFNYLLGNYSGKYSISKYSYTNEAGKPRVLVFFSPIMSIETYRKTIDSIYNIWWLFIPLYILLLIVAVILISKRTRQFLIPLNNAILGFTHGKKVSVADYKGPYEFLEIARNFNTLVEQLTESKEERKRMDDEKKRMLTDISHDLRTPITVIQGYSKAICDGLVAEKDKDKYIETIYRKASALTELTETFFEYSKLEHPIFEIEPEITNICEFCQEYLAEKYQEIDHAGIHLAVNLPESAILCMIDKKIFRRVLENLLCNTLKYNPAGTTFYFSMTAKQKQVCITVGDDGVGIPAAISQTVFEPFVVGDSARGGTNQGTGLGMAIVKKIVTAHNGTIRLVLPPHAHYSTEFEINLPIKTADRI